MPKNTQEGKKAIRNSGYAKIECIILEECENQNGCYIIQTVEGETLIVRMKHIKVIDSD